jgi:CheY-like chemotaxis protein
MKSIPVLVIRRSDTLFAHQLAIVPGTAELRFVKTVAEAIATVVAGFAPALIVLEERWPGDASAQELERLQRIAPLGRIWRVAGPWCEGELRTSPPPAGTLRSYWHQAQSRIGAEIKRLASGEPARSTLAATATDEEIHLAAETPLPLESPVLVLIYASEREAGTALLDVCCELGCHGIWTKQLQGTVTNDVDLAICDLRSDELSDMRTSQQLRQIVGEVPLLAVVGFPRPEDLEAAYGNGFVGMISKPFELSDVAWQLRNATAETSKFTSQSISRADRKAEIRFPALF